MNDKDKIDPKSGCAGCFIGFVIICITTALISMGGLLSHIFEIPKEAWALICIIAVCMPIVILILAKILGD